MTFRFLSLIGFVVCSLLVATALYFQHIEGLDPCPLCIFQRVAFISMGFIFLIAFLHNPRGWIKKLYALLASLSGIFGIAIAARHVWLQNIPADQVPECGPGLSFMLEALPFKKMLETVLKGSGECADVHWTLFSLSMPSWSLIWLVVLTLVSFRMLLKK